MIYPAIDLCNIVEIMKIIRTVGHIVSLTCWQHKFESNILMIIILDISTYPLYCSASQRLHHKAMAMDSFQILSYSPWGYLLLPVF